MKTTIALLALVAGAFGQTPPAAAPAPTKAAAAPAKPARDPGLYATIKTSMGSITVKLYEKEAPITVKNFVGLAKGTKPWTDPKTHQKVVGRPLYNGTTFHRVIPGFMIQGGDPAGDGAGDVGFTIADEFASPYKYDTPGRLAMARTDAPHSAASQFFITDAPAPSLNGQYTIFGQVIEGQDVVHKIISVPRNSADKPLTPVKILAVVITREGPPPVTPASTAKKAAAKTTTKK